MCVALVNHSRLSIKTPTNSSRKNESSRERAEKFSVRRRRFFCVFAFDPENGFVRWCRCVRLRRDTICRQLNYPLLLIANDPMIDCNTHSETS